MVAFLHLHGCVCGCVIARWRKPRALLGVSPPAQCQEISQTWPICNSSHSHEDSQSRRAISKQLPTLFVKLNQLPLVQILFNISIQLGYYVYIINSVDKNVEKWERKTVDSLFKSIKNSVQHDFHACIWPIQNVMELNKY